MSEHPKFRSILVGIATIVVFLISLTPMLHLCDKNSIWLQAPLMLFCLLFFPAWLQRAGQLRQVATRSLLSIVAVLGLQMVFLTWLHSEYFPRWLLFPEPRHHVRPAGNSSVKSFNPTTPANAGQPVQFRFAACAFGSGVAEFPR